MKTPYIGTFRVSQEFKGDKHDGLDLVGIQSKEIRATVSGRVSRAGWENPSNHEQGFGQRVSIDFSIAGTMHSAYYGHLSSINVRVGDPVQVGDVIGIEGNTGNSTGSHVHYCIRRGGIKGKHIDICAFSGIPNAMGEYNGDPVNAVEDTNVVSEAASCPYPEPAQLVRFGTRGDAVRWVQCHLNASGYDCGAVDGICGARTAKAIRDYQRAKGLAVDGIVGPNTRAAMTK